MVKRRRKWHPTPVLLPGKSHGLSSLGGCSPWGSKESDTTERLHFKFSLSCIGEGNGNPLQCSCLENPRNRRAWWAAIHGVAQRIQICSNIQSKVNIWFSTKIPGKYSGKWNKYLTMAFWKTKLKKFFQAEKILKRDKYLWKEIRQSEHFQLGLQVAQWLTICVSTGEGTGWIPGRGTNIPNDLCYSIHHAWRNSRK